MEKVKKFNYVVFSILMLSLIVNVILFIVLNSTNINLQNSRIELENQSGYYSFNSILSNLTAKNGTITDSGILVNIHDTIMIQPLLTIQFISGIDSNNVIPKAVLYEYSPVKSDFTLCDSIEYSDSKSFRYIAKNNGVKYLFGKIDLPTGNSNETFIQMSRFIVLDSTGNSIKSDSRIDANQLIDKFISFTNNLK